MVDFAGLFDSIPPEELDHRRLRAQHFCRQMIRQQPDHLGYKFLYELLGNTQELERFVRANMPPAYSDEPVRPKRELTLSSRHRAMLKRAGTHDYSAEFKAADAAENQPITRRQAFKKGAEMIAAGGATLTGAAAFAKMISEHVKAADEMQEAIDSGTHSIHAIDETVAKYKEAELAANRHDPQSGAIFQEATALSAQLEAREKTARQKRDALADSAHQHSRNANVAGIAGIAGTVLIAGMGIGTSLVLDKQLTQLEHQRAVNHWKLEALDEEKAMMMFLADNLAPFLQHELNRKEPPRLG